MVYSVEHVIFLCVFAVVLLLLVVVLELETHTTIVRVGLLFFLYIGSGEQFFKGT